jgi:hypothetical protein
MLSFIKFFHIDFATNITVDTQPRVLPELGQPCASRHSECHQNLNRCAAHIYSANYEDLEEYLQMSVFTKKQTILIQIFIFFLF